jgi:tetratricopeptide (TPR) repeat protein
MARSRLAWWIGIPAGIAISSCLGFVLGRMWLERRQPIVVQETPVQPAPQPAASYRRKAVDVQMQQELPRSVERPGSRFAALNNRAIETLNLGEIDKAVGMFEECHAGEPAEDVFQRNLAEALARRAVRDYELQHPCPDCIADLERAVELAPQREDIAKLLEHWRKEAEVEKDYWRESSQHFDLAYDGEKRELVWGSGAS